MTYGNEATGEPERLRRSSLRFSWPRRGASLVSGLALRVMAISFYLLLILCPWQPISFVIPASALSNVVGTLGAKYILKEEVNAARWAGSHYLRLHWRDARVSGLISRFVSLYSSLEFVFGRGNILATQSKCGRRHNIQRTSGHLAEVLAHAWRHVTETIPNQ